MRKIIGAWFAALAIGACAPRPQQVMAAQAIPMAPHNEIITIGIEGRLVKKNSCLLLSRRWRAREVDYLLIWPSGSRFNGSAIVAANPFGEERAVLVGEDVEIEGNSPDWPDLPNMYDYLLGWRERCGGRPFFVSAIRPAA